jgi:hypothetical protein
MGSASLSLRETFAYQWAESPQAVFQISVDVPESPRFKTAKSKHEDR